MPNPNQISVNNVKAGVVNGAGPPGQSPGAGRACESCYSKCPPGTQAHPSPLPWAPLHRPGDWPGGGGCTLPGGALMGSEGSVVPGPGVVWAGDSCGMLSAVTGSA